MKQEHTVVTYLHFKMIQHLDSKLFAQSFISECTSPDKDLYLCTQNKCTNNCNSKFN